MIGNLEAAVRALLADALPALFGGETPPVQLQVTSDLLELDPSSVEAAASEPRPDDAVDLLGFEAAAPEGPYTLTRPPHPGPRRVQLQTTAGDLIWLRDDEVRWDGGDARQFRLALAPARVLTDVARLRVLYGVTSIFARLKARQTLELQLVASDPAKRDAAEALAIAAIALNRARLVEAARAPYQDGSYGAAVEVQSLQLVKSAGAAGGRQLTLVAGVELKATRALTGGEGALIRDIDLRVATS